MVYFGLSLLTLAAMLWWIRNRPQKELWVAWVYAKRAKKGRYSIRGFRQTFRLDPTLRVPPGFDQWYFGGGRNDVAYTGPIAFCDRTKRFNTINPATLDVLERIAHIRDQWVAGEIKDPYCLFKYGKEK